ncbi:MAG: arginyltransferase [Acidobacteria bacterium]|nr:arginyltransferase [Acidobacteriota bacterium]
MGGDETSRQVPEGPGGTDLPPGLPTVAGDRPRLVRQILGDPEPCVYLPAEQARMSFRYVEGCPGDAYQDMLERGWRRFGRMFFRPACAACHECRSLRLDVVGFEPTRSMRRNQRRNQDLEVRIGRPSLSGAHLDLYRRYHRDMAERRGWPDRGIDPLDYYRTFIEGFGGFGYELRLELDGRLVGVSLFDRLPAAVSAVYSFYEPELRSRGLGVFALLCQVRLARDDGIPWLYLGFRVAGNPSMRYKAQYRPHQLLEGRPDLSEEPEWSPG